MDADENDAVKVYMQELAYVLPLTKEEEAQMFQEMEQSGERGELAERRLIEGNLHLVPPIAERHKAGNLSMLDLIQEGNLGLMRAIKEFPKIDLDDFSGYATSCIEDAIRSAITNLNPTEPKFPNRGNERNRCLQPLTITNTILLMFAPMGCAKRSSASV